MKKSLKDDPKLNIADGSESSSLKDSDSSAVSYNSKTTQSTIRLPGEISGFRKLLGLAKPNPIDPVIRVRKFRAEFDDRIDKIKKITK